MDTTRAADLAADLSATPDYDVGLVSLNQWQIAWRRFRRHRLAMFGTALFFGIVAGAIVLPFFFPYDFYTIPTPDPACRIGCPPSAGALVRHDRRAPARRLHAGRQRRPDLTRHRHRRGAWRRDHRVDRRWRRGLLRRLDRQRPDARGRRAAEPAAAVRHPRRRQVPRRRQLVRRAAGVHGLRLGRHRATRALACS